MIMAFFATCLSLIAVAAIAISAFGIGRPLARALALDDDLLATVVWSLALGLLAASQLFVALALAGLLYRAVIGVFTASACFWGLGEIAQVYFAQSARRRQARESRSLGHGCQAGPARWIAAAVLGSAAVAGLASLIAALAPPTAPEALAARLEVPKAFLIDHALVALPFHEDASCALLTEMCFLWGLAIEGPVAAQLLAWGIGVLLALAAVLLASPVVGRSWGWLVGASVPLVPGIAHQMGIPQVDVPLALWLTLALVAVRQALDEPRESGQFIAAGAMLGAGLATHPIALLFALALVVALAGRVAAARDDRRSLLHGAAIALLLATSVPSIWYLRAVWRAHEASSTSNAANRASSLDILGATAGLSSSAERTSGGTGVSPMPGRQQGQAPRDTGPFKWLVPGELFAMASTPWRLARPADELGGATGALYLLALPGLIIARRLRGLRWLMAVSLLYGGGWSWWSSDARLLFPILPALSVAAIWVWMEAGRAPRLPSALATSAILAVLLPGAMGPLWAARDKVAVAVGWESREQYLLRSEATYRAAIVSNRVLPPEARLLSEDERGFYFRCHVTPEAPYRRTTGYDRTGLAVDDIGQELRRRGFTHLLLVEPVASASPSARSPLAELADRQIAREATSDNPGLVCVATYFGLDTSGRRCRYRLVFVRS